MIKGKYSRQIFYNTDRVNSNKFSISDDKTITLFEDKDGNIWIGTFYGGLNNLDTINKILPPDKARFKHYLANNNLSSSISDNTVMAIQQDFEGYLWIGTFRRRY